MLMLSTLFLRASPYRHNYCDSFMLLFPTDEEQMRIFPPELEIAEYEGFDPKKDIFELAGFGKGIANLLRQSSDPLIIVLDEPWGAGKTTFIKMLAGYLRNDSFPVIYFDAFKNDHADNGFLAVAGEIIRLSQQLEKDETPKYKAFLVKAARTGSVLLRIGAKVGVKAATLGAIDATELEALKTVASDIGKETSTKADEYFESLLKLHSQETETIEGVRQALSELADSLSNQDTDSKRPLVFIIDELDRCRPTFALKLLEKIKHIFSIPNIHFVLSAHLAQLESAVRHSYGTDVEARTYLQKFYNIILHFPERNAHWNDRNATKYIRYLAQTMSLSPDDLELVQNVANARQLSLRAIDRIVTLIAIARAFTPENYLWLNPILSGLCVLRVIDGPMFLRILRNDVTLEEVQSALAFARWPEDTHDSWMMGWWTYCLAKNEADFPKLDWNGFHRSLFQYSIRDRRDIVRLMASHIDRLQLPDRR